MTTEAKAPANPSARLQAAIERRAGEYTKTIDRLRDADDADDVIDAIDEKDVETLREAVELVRCLRRLLEGRTAREVHGAFGAPGAFGYETEIGQALVETYRGAP